MTIWRKQIDAVGHPAPPLTIWRRGRKIKDQWPYVHVKRVVWDGFGVAWMDALLLNLIVQAVDEARPEAGGLGINGPGILWVMRHVRSGVTDRFAVTEASLLPRVVACDSLTLDFVDTGTADLDVAVEYEVSYGEDHDAWIHAKQRDCHDE